MLRGAQELEQCESDSRGVFGGKVGPMFTGKRKRKREVKKGLTRAPRL